MKNKLWVKRFVAMVISLSLSLIIICSIDSLAFAWLLIIYICVFALLACDYKKNIVMLTFLVCFFIFLIGRPFVYEIIGYSGFSAISLNKDARTCVYVCLTISLVSIVVGYSLGKRISISRNEKKVRKMKDERFTPAVKKVSMYTTILLYSLVIIENILGCVYISNVGYTASFAMEHDYQLPFGLHALVMMAPVAFALFLATLPTKRESLLPILLFVISNIVLVVSGHRFGIISCLLVLIVYFVWRSNTDGVSWITGKKILCIIAVAPLIVVLMQYITYWRDGNDINTKVDPVVAFMSGVGGSSDLIGAVEQYGDRALNENTLYSFGSVWRGLNGNIIAELLGVDAPYGRTQTVDYAKNAHSLSSALTYYFYSDRYLAGYGLGGCYIAELYYDFSIPGVIIGNVLIGIVIGLIRRLEKNRVIYNFICFFLILLLFRIPRDSFDYPIARLLNLKNILIFSFMYFSARYISGTRFIKRDNDK